MDPHNNNNQGSFGNNQLSSRNNNAHLKDNTAGVPGKDEDPPEKTAERGNPQTSDRQPQYSGGFTIIPPNQSRRSKLTSMAQKEEQELQKWKEANRPGPVNLNPEKLGGNVSLAEARQKQLVDARCSKLQKKLNKEDLDRRKRQEEEEENQRRKAVQREKAERLEEKKRQEEQRRRQQHREDHLRATNTFLQRFERTAPGPPASSSATHTSSRSEADESSQRPKSSKSEREVQLDHRRVNSAFLDRLEGRGRGGEEEEEEGDHEKECPDFTFEDRNSDEGRQPVAHLDLDTDQSWTQDTGSDPDYNWALMKLSNSFPEVSKVFLEDILDQCNGDYDEASVLLISSLS